MRNPRRYGLRNLQHEFSGHAPDFGITGPWNKANAALFRQAIEVHVSASSVVTSGTFRGVIAVTHYFDSATKLWVAFDQTNTFVAGWKLYPSQIVKLLTKGDIT